MAYHQKIYPDDSFKTGEKINTMKAHENGYKDNIKVIEE
jgi:hypothetical protein